MWAGPARSFKVVCGEIGCAMQAEPGCVRKSLNHGPAGWIAPFPVLSPPASRSDCGSLAPPSRQTNASAFQLHPALSATAGESKERRCTQTVSRPREGLRGQAPASAVSTHIRHRHPHVIAVTPTLTTNRHFLLTSISGCVELCFMPVQPQ